MEWKGAKFLKLWDKRKVKDGLTNEGKVSLCQVDAYKTTTISFVERESKLLYIVLKMNPLLMHMIIAKESLKKGLISW